MVEVHLYDDTEEAGDFGHGASGGGSHIVAQSSPKSFILGTQPLAVQLRKRCRHKALHAETRKRVRLLATGIARSASRNLKCSPRDRHCAQAQAQRLDHSQDGGEFGIATG